LFTKLAINKYKTQHIRSSCSSAGRGQCRAHRENHGQYTWRSCTEIQWACFQPHIQPLQQLEVTGHTHIPCIQRRDQNDTSAKFARAARVFSCTNDHSSSSAPLGVGSSKVSDAPIPITENPRPGWKATLETVRYRPGRSRPTRAATHSTASFAFSAIDPSTDVGLASDSPTLLMTSPTPPPSFRPVTMPLTTGIE